MFEAQWAISGGVFARRILNLCCIRRSLSSLKRRATTTWTILKLSDNAKTFLTGSNERTITPYLVKVVTVTVRMTPDDNGRRYSDTCYWRTNEKIRVHTVLVVHGGMRRDFALSRVTSKSALPP